MSWYLNKWRLATLFCGISMLYYGAKVEGAPDWDVPVSFLMAMSTYVLMPWFDRALEQKRWVEAAALATVCVDTTYSLYWDWMGNCAASQMVNFPASLSLFLMCWLVWSVLPKFVKS